MTVDNTLPVYGKKQILSDPVSLFASLHQHGRAEDEEKLSLKHLYLIMVNEIISTR